MTRPFSGGAPGRQQLEVLEVPFLAPDAHVAVLHVLRVVLDVLVAVPSRLALALNVPVEVLDTLAAVLEALAEAPGVHVEVLEALFVAVTRSPWRSTRSSWRRDSTR